jgi:DNA-binding transcriptional regulator YhcF (GntR family)
MRKYGLSAMRGTMAHFGGCDLYPDRAMEDPMTHRFAIDAASAVPPYEQLKRQVREGVADGSLTPGAHLPAVRSLAEELGIAPGTVARAWKELQADGVVETRGRAGTVIAWSGDSATAAAEQAAAEYVARVRELGVDRAEALRLVERALSAD